MPLWSGLSCLAGESDTKLTFTEDKVGGENQQATVDLFSSHHFGLEDQGNILMK